MVVTDRPSYSAAVLRGDVPGPQELMTSILGVKVMKREEIIQEMTTRYGFVRECAEDICRTSDLINFRHDDEWCKLHCVDEEEELEAVSE